MYGTRTFSSDLKRPHQQYCRHHDTHRLNAEKLIVAAYSFSAILGLFSSGPDTLYMD